MCSTDWTAKLQLQILGPKLLLACPLINLYIYSHQVFNWHWISPIDRSNRKRLHVCMRRLGCLESFDCLGKRKKLIPETFILSIQDYKWILVYFTTRSLVNYTEYVIYTRWVILCIYTHRSHFLFPLYEIYMWFYEDKE